MRVSDASLFLDAIWINMKGEKERGDGVPWGRDSLPYLRMICEYARAMGRLLRERDGQDSPWIPGHLKHGKYSSGQPQIYRPRQP